MNETTSMSQPQLQIARLRRHKGVTQEDLANHLGVTFQAVSKWETGAACPDIALLPAIAAYFRTSVDDVLGCAPAAPTPEALLPTLRAAFTACPDEQRYRAAWELCCLLHEAVATDGWHKQVPWDTSRPPCLHRYDGWGLSADARAEGFTALSDGVMTIGLREAAARPQPQASRKMARFFQRLGREGALDVLLALCAAQGDGDEPITLPVAQVAQSTGLTPDACMNVLRELEDCDWVRLADGDEPGCSMVKRMDSLVLPVIALVRGFKSFL